MSFVLACVLLQAVTAHPFFPADQSTSESAASSPDIAEASKLTQEVVKLFGEKRYRDALPMAKQALRIREKVLGPDDELIAFSLNNLAEIHFAETRYSDAEPLFKKSLGILEKKWGHDSGNLTNTMERLALTRFALNDNGGAEHLYLRALAINEKVSGPVALVTGRTLTKVGIFFQRTNRLERAADYFKRGIAAIDKAPGADDQEVVDLLYRCACALSESNQSAEAQKYLERAEKRLPPSSPVKKGVLQGQATYTTRPEYPAAAKQLRITGSVLVEVVIDECGRVMSAAALKGRSELAPAAVKAARAWRFLPTKLEGRPVKVIGAITFNFEM